MIDVQGKGRIAYRTGGNIENAANIKDYAGGLLGIGECGSADGECGGGEGTVQLCDELC